MSAELDHPYVFGSHAANAPGDARGVPAVVGGESATSGAGTWTSEVASDDELSVLCRGAADALPPSVRTALVLLPPRRPTTVRDGPVPTAVATSSPATTPVLKIEWLLQEGPVRTSLASGEPTVSGRLGADQRWPRFARAVSAHDTVSAAAVPIPLEAEVGSGVLAAYSADVGAFDRRDLRTLSAFAGVVADVVVRGLREAGSDDEDPEVDAVVNQAIGVLITRHCDEEQARRRLARICESTGQPLAAAARMIVDEAQVEAHLRFLVRSPGHDRDA